MATATKDFKVKHGLQVAEGATFGGPITVAEPTLPSHAVTKSYVDFLAALAGLALLDGGSPGTTEWGLSIDGGPANQT